MSPPAPPSPEPGPPPGTGRTGPSLLRIVAALAANAVPLVGVLALHWSAGAMLAVFWFETLFTAAANGVRITAHRRLTHARGHYHPQLGITVGSGPKGKQRNLITDKTTFLAEYLMGAFLFTGAHGLFLVVILRVFSQRDGGGAGSPWAIDPANLLHGVLAVAAVTALELTIDLTTLRDRPFSWVRSRAEAVMGRVVILHLVIIGGAFLMLSFNTPIAMLAVLVALKTLVDVGQAAAGARELPSRPPRWMATVAKKQGKDLDTEWTKTLAAQRKRAADDELPREIAGAAR